jgi:ferredoxin
MADIKTPVSVQGDQQAQNQTAAPVVATASAVDQAAPSTKKAYVNQDICIQCGTCAMMYPDYFEILPDGKVKEKGDGTVPADQLQDILGTCPNGALWETK